MPAVISISLITPKPGRFEEFMTLQLAQLQRLRGQVAGLVGSRLYRAFDGRSAIMLAVFDTAEDQRRFAASPDLKDHLARVRDLVEPAAPGLYEVTYLFGDV